VIGGRASFVSNRSIPRFRERLRDHRADADRDLPSYARNAVRVPLDRPRLRHAGSASRTTTSRARIACLARLQRPRRRARRYAPAHGCAQAARRTGQRRNPRDAHPADSRARVP
jgi:hypothetical protein